LSLKAVAVSLAAAGAVLAGCGGGGKPHQTTPSPKPPQHQQPPGVGQTRFFAPDSVWNKPIPANAPLDPRSAQLVAHLAASAQRTTIDYKSYSAPIYRVPANQPKRRVQLDNGSAPLLQKAFDAVPIPADAQPSPGTDGNAIVYQPATDTAWEFWRLRRGQDGFHAAYGGRVVALSQNPGYFRDIRSAGGGYIERWFWGAAASKLVKLGGLITVSDLKKGHIDHALAIAIPAPRRGWYTPPAEATDGTDPSPDAVPEGAHFRLDPKLDIATMALPPVTKMLAEAAQRYGLIVNNGSSAVSFYAEDPLGLPHDPYIKLFNGYLPHDLAAAFPWRHLQLLKMDLRRNGSRPSS
jgi:hypothetical protein